MNSANYCPAGGCDFSLRIKQEGAGFGDQVYALAVDWDTTKPYTDASSFFEIALNVPASQGRILDIELLYTPDVGVLGFPLTPEVRAGYAPPLQSGEEVFYTSDTDSILLDFFVDGPYDLDALSSFRCPQRTVLTRIETSFEAIGVDSLRFGCAALNRDGTLGSTLLQGSFGYPSEFGTIRGQEGTLDCAGRMITGLHGRAGQVVDQIGVRCSDVAQALEGTYESGLGDAFGSSTGGSPAENSCGAGYVATGADVWLETVFGGIDDIKLVCTRIESLAASGDEDGDGHTNEVDNCPSDVNADQSLDSDRDGIGDACDVRHEPPPPTTIIFSGDRDVTEVYCPPGWAITAANVEAGRSWDNSYPDSLVGVSFTCGELQPEGTLDGSAGTPSAVIGDDSGSTQGAVSCGANLVTGFKGMKGRVIDKLGLLCSSLDQALVGDSDPSLGSPVGGGSTGSPVEQACPVGQVVTGAKVSVLHLTYGEHIRGIDPICSTLVDLRGAGGELTLARDETTLPFFGSHDSDGFNCPQGWAIAQGDVLYARIYDDDYPDSLTGVSFSCAQVLPDNTLDMSDLERYPMVGDTSERSRGTTSCEGSFVTGLRGRTGGVIDRLGLVCSTIDQVGLGTSNSALGSSVGGAGGSAAESRCPVGAIGTGVRVSFVKGHYTDELFNGAHIQRIELTCSPLPDHDGDGVASAHEFAFCEDEEEQDCAQLSHQTRLASLLILNAELTETEFASHLASYQASGLSEMDYCLAVVDSMVADAQGRGLHPPAASAARQQICRWQPHFTSNRRLAEAEEDFCALDDPDSGGNRLLIAQAEKAVQSDSGDVCRVFNFLTRAKDVPLSILGEGYNPRFTSLLETALISEVFAPDTADTLEVILDALFPELMCELASDNLYSTMQSQMLGLASTYLTPGLKATMLAAHWNETRESVIQEDLGISFTTDYENLLSTHDKLEEASAMCFMKGAGEASSVAGWLARRAESRFASAYPLELGGYVIQSPVAFFASGLGLAIFNQVEYYRCMAPFMSAAAFGDPQVRAQFLEELEAIESTVEDEIDEYNGTVASQFQVVGEMANPDGSGIFDSYAAPIEALYEEGKVNPGFLDFEGESLLPTVVERPPLHVVLPNRTLICWRGVTAPGQR